MMSFLVSLIASEVTALVLPAASVLVTIFACSLVQRRHSPRILSSAAFLTAGSVFAHSARTSAGARSSTRNFFSADVAIIAPLLWLVVGCSKVLRSVRNLRLHQSRQVSQRFLP